MATSKLHREGPRTPQIKVPLAMLTRDLQRCVAGMPDNDAREAVTEWLKRTRQSEDTSASPSDAVLNDFIRLCVQGRLQPLLAAYGIPHPTYNYLEDFDENAKGPWDTLPPTWAVTTPAVWSVLGFDVAFPIGVPASVLTATADWVEYYARHGFNVLTYKTIRSQPREALDQPNWVFLDQLDQPFDPDSLPDHVIGEPNGWPQNRFACSTANSFGVPSVKPEIWMRDVGECLKRLRSDQLLIVSVMGTYEEYFGQELIKDFVKVARMAEEAGARAVELNLSCPNGVDPESGEVKPPICDDPDDALQIVKAVREALRLRTRLVAKLGYMDREKLERVTVPLVSAGLVDGVSGINTVQMMVCDRAGNPTFRGGEKPRDKAGVSGVAIRELGLRFVRWLSEIRKENNASFDIIGMGGVMRPDDVFAYQRAGAAAVQTATAAFLNPRLPMEIYEQSGGEASSDLDIEARGIALDVLATGPTGLRDVAQRLQEAYPPEWAILERTRILLQHLEAEGLVESFRDEGRLVYTAASTVEA